MRCWSCGTEPEDTYKVESMENSHAVATIVRWPDATDHLHAERPPTPEELAEAGAQARLRIEEQWTC